MNRSQGMTLMEVLVSLVVVSVAVLALARFGALAVDTQHQVANRTFARIVAENVLADIALAPPSVGARQQGQTTLANQTWVWQAVVGPTPNTELMRVDVGVSLISHPDQTVVVHTGFVAP